METVRTVLNKQKERLTQFTGREKSVKKKKRSWLHGKLNYNVVALSEDVFAVAKGWEFLTR